MGETGHDFAYLMSLCRKGSQDAARQIITEHGDLVLRVVRQHLPHILRRVFDSQDFAQVAWHSVFRHRSRFARFAAPREFLAFLTAVAANKVRMEVRRRCQQTKHNLNREKQFTPAIGRQSSSRDSTPSQLAIARETLSGLLAGQPPRTQTIIRLRCLGLSSHEIADRVGLNVGSVRRILREVSRGMTK